MVVKDLSNIIDIRNEAFPNCSPILRWYSKSNHTIKLRSQEIGVFMSAEKLLESVFLFSVEYKLFFANISENLVI
jgi:hypothetical protein